MSESKQHNWPLSSAVVATAATAAPALSERIAVGRRLRSLASIATASQPPGDVCATAAI